MVCVCVCALSLLGCWYVLCVVLLWYVIVVGGVAAIGVTVGVFGVIAGMVVMLLLVVVWYVML